MKIYFNVKQKALDIEDESFVGKDGIGEDALGFAKEGVFIFDGCAEMADAKAAHPSLSC